MVLKAAMVAVCAMAMILNLSFVGCGTGDGDDDPTLDGDNEPTDGDTTENDNDDTTDTVDNNEGEGEVENETDPHLCDKVMPLEGRWFCDFSGNYMYVEVAPSEDGATCVVTFSGEAAVFRGQMEGTSLPLRKYWTFPPEYYTQCMMEDDTLIIEDVTDDIEDIAYYRD